MEGYTLISSLLHDKFKENPEIRQYCQAIEAKSLEFAKSEFRAQNACEENIRLTLDVANLQSISQTISENNKAQVALDELLKKFYKEHLKYSFDVDECELEKIAAYDEIKLELEARDSINIYQRLYEHKIETATKLEGRNIVKKYRKAEEEHSKTKAERHQLEERVKKLKTKKEEFQARKLEENKLLFQLVQGSIELEKLSPQQQSQAVFSASQHITPPNLNIQKVGLSSRLPVNFKQFEIRTIPQLPRFRPINQLNGLNRLLQQSEVIRKSMETTPIVLSGDFAIPKPLPSILKIPKDIQKSAVAEPSQKTVSFHVDLCKDGMSNFETQEATQKTTTPHDTLDPSHSETIDDSEESSTVDESVEPKIEILENLLIKPVPSTSKNASNIKRKATDKDDSDHQQHRPPFKIRKSSTSQKDDENPMNIHSKNFMDMFLELSKETSEILSPEFSPTRNHNQTLNLSPSSPPPPQFVQPKSKAKYIKEKKSIERMFREPEQQREKSKNPKTKASKKQFDGFESFLSQFSDAMGDGKTNDDDKPSDHDMSFDFGTEGMGPNDDDGDNLSFEF